jgi:hypothetical protein
MANRPKNQEIVSQGGEIKLDVYFREYSGGNLVDPDTIPQFNIYDPSNNLVFSGSGERISTGYYIATYQLAINAQVSNTWKIEWLAYINGALVQGAYEYFIVVESGSALFSGSIIISDYDLLRIKAFLGAPVNKKFSLSNDEIKEIVIYKALEDYYSKFPIKTIQEINILGSMEIPFPDNEEVYGVLKARFVNKLQTNRNTGSSFLDILKYQGLSSGIISSGSFGNNTFNPNYLKQARIMSRSIPETLIKEATYSADIDIVDRKINAFSEKESTLHIVWASYSLDFNRIPYHRKRLVIKLAGAYLIDEYIRLWNLRPDVGDDISFDVGKLQDESDKLKEETIKKWEEDLPNLMWIRK